VAQGKKESCFNSSMEDQARLWHRRYGHLSFNGLNLLTQKEMVRGLPLLGRSSSVCKDCLVGKQQRNPFPQESTWRASQSQSQKILSFLNNIRVGLRKKVV
nr:retrovirus-related Pol polyprotein from transposon TNT 1-94 [Tanacetum cinerariifolium]